ncbi:MAG: beta-N-acetylhexosaminidase [Gammaproteobacteria bacterium]|nr:beta-N-acetylhexosaminidase [Gammaproteobacteria bacterium]
MTLGPIMIDVAGLELSRDDEDLLRHPAIGGVILFQRNFESVDQLCALTKQIHAIRRPPLLIAVDQEGGRVQRFKTPFTRLPSLGSIGDSYASNAENALHKARACGWLMAAELIACGIDLSFAPVVDIDHGICDVIGDRAFHADPHVVTELATAYMAGMHLAGMASTAKHFPGHGCVTDDSHLTLPVDRRSYADIADDLLPYELLIANGLNAVMMALVSYPQIDEQPASFSQAWIQAELRRQLRFRGAVFSDDLSMAGAAVMGDILERSRHALAAGCDMILICNDREAAIAVVDRMEDYSDPASQSRLASLHHKPGEQWQELLQSSQWQKASASIMSTDLF